MEAGTTPAPATGSATIADLCAAAAAKFGDQIAIKHKVDGGWADVTFAQVGAIVAEIGLGLIALGLQPGERVAILCDTRPEWAYADFAISSAGGVVVPIYPTNSADECEWVAGNSESVFVVCEDAGQVAKIVAVRERLHALREIIVVDPTGDVADAISLDEVRRRADRHDARLLADRTAAVGPDDPFTFIYTSGTTGPPKGCVLTHGNYRSVLDMVNERGSIGAEGDLIYLYLPLAHAFALLIQLAAVDLGVPIAYYGGDTKAIVGELMEVKPTYLPSVPRVFEKVYTLAQQQFAPHELETIRTVGGQIQELQVRGQTVPQELRDRFAELQPKADFVKGLFGGRMREAVTGAAPIAREILEFFWGCGVPVMEGYGMTETSTVATSSRPDAHRFGSVGQPLPGVEVKTAEDGELLIRGANIFRGYYKNDDASFGAIDEGWLHTGDLGSVDADGYVYITGRKKDIIITAGGKNITPANLENDLKQNRWVSQAVMHGDRRPYPVMLITLDEEEIVPWAQGRTDPPIADVSMPALANDPQVRALIQGELDKANAKYAPVEQVKKFVILDHDLSQETGELTPTLKVKRNVVNEAYRPLFDELYGDS
ncbi:MAG TPA: AMP-dependent synthetase/ligase [Baekduia sp.]|nr:AMP-dependent synthetase/ligase [Baekduia sp.]